MLKPILISFGSLSLVIGIIGIVVPGLPTTPFLLLTAGLYLKSSDYLYKKLISNRWAGNYIHQYKAHKGLTKKSKIYAISVMWLMITISCLLMSTSLSKQIAVLAAGVIGTIVMGFVVPTMRISDSNNHQI